MGRKSSNKAEYFFHYVSARKTIFILESRWKNDGYAVWFKLLEVLAASEGHFYDLNPPQNLEYFRAKMLVQDDIRADILDLLADLGNIDPVLYREHRILWCQALVDDLGETLYQKRKHPAPSKPTIVNGIISPEIPSEKVYPRGNDTTEGISVESIPGGSGVREAREGRQAETPPAAAFSLTALKKRLADASILTTPAELESIAAELVARSADCETFIAWALAKAAKARQPSSWFARGLLEWDWIGKWRAEGGGPPKAETPYVLNLHHSTPEEDAEVERLAAETRARLHMVDPPAEGEATAAAGAKNELDAIEF